MSTTQAHIVHTAGDVPDEVGIPADPAALRALPATDLPGLARTLRRRLVEITSRTGGHLGPNLGVVELTIALHRGRAAARGEPGQGTPGPAGHPLSAVPLPPGDRRCPGAMGQSQLLCPFLEASPSPAPFPKTRARSRGGITDGDRCWAALTKGQQVHPARPHAPDVLPKPESPPVILRRYHTGGG